MLQWDVQWRVASKKNLNAYHSFGKVYLPKIFYTARGQYNALSPFFGAFYSDKRYQLRKKLKIDVPRFNTNYMRNSVARRGAIVWNTLVPQLNDDIDNVKKYAIMARRSKALLHLDFDCISPQTLTRREEDFKYN